MGIANIHEVRHEHLRIAVADVAVERKLLDVPRLHRVWHRLIPEVDVEAHNAAKHLHRVPLRCPLKRNAGLHKRDGLASCKALSIWPCIGNKAESQRVQSTRAASTGAGLGDEPPTYADTGILCVEQTAAHRKSNVDVEHAGQCIPLVATTCSTTAARYRTGKGKSVNCHFLPAQTMATTRSQRELSLLGAVLVISYLIMRLGSAGEGRAMTAVSATLPPASAMAWAAGTKRPSCMRTTVNEASRLTCVQRGAEPWKSPSSCVQQM